MFWATHLCRICAQINDVCIPIFENDSNRNIDTKIKKCLSINVFKGDFKPKEVCSSCFNKLNEFCCFIELCHASNNKFDAILYQSGHNCQVISQDWQGKVQETIGSSTSNLTTNDAQDNSVIVSKNGSNIGDCSDIIMYLPIAENLEVQSRCINGQNVISLVNDTNNFSSDINMDFVVNNISTESLDTQNIDQLNLKKVDGEFNSNQTVLRHASSYSSVKNCNVYQIPHSNLQTVQVCENDGNIKQVLEKNGSVNLVQNSYTDNLNINHNLNASNFSKIDSVSNNSVRNTSSVNVSNVNYVNVENDDVSATTENVAKLYHINSNSNVKTCDFIQTVPDALNISELNVEINKKSKKCNIISVKTIQKIIQAETKQKKIAQVNNNEQMNKEASNKVKPFPCTSCNKSFMRKLTLTAHMATHTNFRPFVCKVCDKSFAIRWDLTCHQRVHTNLYRCQHCSKCFSVPSKLQRHVRIHTGVRPFVCPVKNCGRSFSDKRNLVGHQFTHTDAREFICDVCKKAYKTKSQLKDHKRAHSDDTPFKCDVCCKSYKWKTNLFLHKKKHNGYKCPNCDKDCKKLANLIKHRKECKSKD